RAVCERIVRREGRKNNTARIQRQRLQIDTERIMKPLIPTLLCGGIPAIASTSSPAAFQPTFTSIKRFTFVRWHAKHPTIQTRTRCDHPIFDTKLTAIEPSLVSVDFSNALLSYDETITQHYLSTNDASVEQLTPATALVVFIIGLIPFLWATYEFWRRIAFGEPFGTGSDSVIIPSSPDHRVFIGEDGNANSSRGRRTLDKSALTVAYVLFAVAASSVIVAVASVVMGPRPGL
ncbi:hypothetical protein ACHAWX_000693, partial [Stephanocyclus meneghinianus]